MTFNFEQLLIAVGAILMTWIFNNTKLREGITDWFISRLGKDSYNVNNHNVSVSLKSIKFESKLNEFDNPLKTELYHYYIDTVLTNMEDLVNEILTKEKKLTFEDTKKLIKNTMYDKLTHINTQIDQNINMPNPLQDKFDKFRNYLTMQHTYAIDHALQSPNKKLLLIQVLDAIDNNSRWFLFYSTEMFDNFNGHFDALSRKDIFNR